MRREAREEAQRWLIQAKDEFQDAGVPSRFYTDPEEAREAMELARAMLEMVEERLRES